MKRWPLGAHSRSFCRRRCVRWRPDFTGLDEIELSDDKDAIRAALARQTPDRLRLAAQAMRLGFPTEEIAAITKYDPWFLGEIETILAVEI